MFLTAVMALLLPSGAFAQFHGASVLKNPLGPAGTPFAHVGDKVRTQIRILNNDDCDDTITISNIFDTTHHFIGDELSTNLLRINGGFGGVNFAGFTNDVNLPSFGSFVTVFYTNFVLAGDQRLTNYAGWAFGKPAVLQDDAMTTGIDRHD